MSKIKNIFITATILLVSLSCSDSDPLDNPDGGDTDIEDQYEAPSYSDDYSTIADWSLRTKWNLANVHDPSVEKCGDYYYMYSTDASYGDAHAGNGHFMVRRSKDLVDWEFRGTAMPETPVWVRDTLNSIRGKNGLPPVSNPVYGHWAPVVRKVGDKYRLYYSIIVDNYIQSGKQNTVSNFDGSWTEHAFIGMMETDDLSGNSWSDKGMVIHSSTDRGTDWSRSNLDDWNAYFKWNAIDPSLIVTPDNKQWLIYGSWHSGIAAVELNPETGKPYNLDNLADFGVCIARRENNDNNRWQAQEAPEIVYNPETGYYYLFLAYDELSVAYNTRVCRSRNITGPYTGYDGKDITQGGECWPVITHPYKFSNHSGWVGLSHCCVFRDTETNEWYYASQGRLPANMSNNPYSNAIMMGHVRVIKWTEDGWPVVLPERFANVPQDEIMEDDLIGTWENIYLNYQYQTQQTSARLTLSADKKASGAIAGTWSYDADKKVLTIGSYKVIVQRELDWEVNPRVPTIVYSGLTDRGISLWGKKVN
ncbi:arabinan endo-1,5-alpha-L-arabinosidase [Dysgonomonas sp. 25]|uniref:arabinan endo-1,5-alpha-L-arabinosidase n=1 Tax=Dysgonomonas sp. 25 TaxID=2302933 RepID=UPI0013D24616|nr:arabinan endo-1,5-alpha-L-arabinosidase [Dysgonomonas sp. 25]NDV68545.1 arabinan endo-1,5-alpha-L-arabinosidase [Dysgonomonas sp. 25]